MDEQLFELCKEVYEKTGWEIKGGQWYAKRLLINPYWDIIGYKPVPEVLTGLNFPTTVKKVEHHPLYTSDYLLEKLPKFQKIYRKTDNITERSTCKLMLLVTDDLNWMAAYRITDGSKYILEEYADTPLKALLKLVLALHATEELK